MASRGSTACRRRARARPVAISTCTPCPGARTSTGTPTTRRTSALFWHHPHFQDRAVQLWEVIAERYRGNAGWRATTRSTSRPTTGEAVRARSTPPDRRHRAVDADQSSSWTATPTRPIHRCLKSRLENVVYACHDYAAAGFVIRRRLPGRRRRPVRRPPRLIERQVPRAHRASSARPRRRSGSVRSGPVYRATRRRDACATRS